MTNEEYARIVAECTKHHAGANTAALIDISFGISTEAGEVIAEIKKALSYGNHLDRTATILELGDLLFSIVAFLNMLDSSLEHAMILNARKVQEKHVGLTSSLQRRVFDDAELPPDVATSRTILILKTAIKLQIGRTRGIPYDEIPEEMVKRLLDDAAHYT